LWWQWGWQQSPARRPLKKENIEPGFSSLNLFFSFLFNSPQFLICSGGPQKLHFEAGKPSLNLFLFKGLAGWGLLPAPLPPQKETVFPRLNIFFSKGWRHLRPGEEQLVSGW
jgi:hypothetical protein